MRRTLVWLALAAAVGLGTSCGDQYKESQGTLDAPIVRTERDGWVVLSSPDQFPNVAFRCFGPNGIYNPRVASGDGARQITVVPDDPACRK